MIDYEVIKLEDGYVIQVTGADKIGKFYSVDDKQRHLSSAKLHALFTGGTLPIYKPKVKA